MKPFQRTAFGLVFLGAASSISFAQSDGGNPLLLYQSCGLVGGLAEVVMEERQKDVPISEMMKRIQGSVSLIGFDSLPIDEDGLARMVLLAYETPRYSSPELQQDAVSGFRNIVEKQCYHQQLQNG